MRITAGWGDYGGPAPDIALNTSRILTWLDCEREASFHYILNRERDWPDSQALQIGTLWHSVVEAVQGSQPIPDVAAQALQSADEADSAGMTNMAKDLRAFALMAPHAIEVYTETYGTSTPTGITLATEQPFWLLLQFPPKFDVLIRGRLDKVGYNLTKGLVNGECKTIGGDPAKFIKERAKHLQDQLYFLALYHAPIPAEWSQKAGCEIPVTPYGTVYDILRKLPYPQKASGGLSVEERIAQWRKSILFTQAIPHTITGCQGAIGEVYQVAQRWRMSTLPNRKSCSNFDNVRCQFYATCYDDIPLDSTYYRDRSPDYVDEVRS